MVAMAMVANAANPSGRFGDMAIGIAPVRLWRTIAIASQSSKIAPKPKSDAGSIIGDRGMAKAMSASMRTARRATKASNVFIARANTARPLCRFGVFKCINANLNSCKIVLPPLQYKCSRTDFWFRRR